MPSLEDDFEKDVQRDREYLLGNAANRSDGVTTNGMSVDVSQPGVDDLTKLALTRLTEAGISVLDMGGRLKSARLNASGNAGLSANPDAAAAARSKLVYEGTTSRDVFTGPSGGYWSDADNWSEGVVPAAGSDVQLSSSADSYDDIPTLSVNGLYTEGGDLEVLGDLTIGTLDVTGGGGVIANSSGGVGSEVTIGAINGGVANLETNGTGVLNVTSASADYYLNGGGEAILSGNDAALDASQFTFINSADGTGATLALKGMAANTGIGYSYQDPGGQFISGLAPGDTIEVTGSSVSSVSFDTSAHTLSITTNEGEFVFNRVYYTSAPTKAGPAGVAGYLLSHDNTTGLEAITLSPFDVFNGTGQAGLWSAAVNWSSGVPGDNALVELNSSASIDDDIASLSLNQLSLNADAMSVISGASLNVQFLDISTGGSITAGGSGSSGTVRIATVSASGAATADLAASGTGSVLRDATTDTTENVNYTAESGGEVIVFNDPASSGSTFAFDAAGSPGTIALAGAQPGSIGALIANIGSGDTLELPGDSGSVSNVNVSFSGTHSLSVTTSTGTFDFNNVDYNSTGKPTAYTVGYDAITQLDTVTIVCYRRGTRIVSERGEVQIENLVIGDRLLTASGVARPVRWLGNRVIDCNRHRDPASVWPICIRAGAFADNEPKRDLWVSPGHSIAIDGNLIQTRNLVNGVTIVQVPVDSVEYWHVELDQHDVIYAEGLAAESYLDTGNRTAFINGGAFLEAFPDFQPKHWAQTCLPLVLEGKAIYQAKAKLIERALQLGYTITDDAQLHLFADGLRIEPMRLSDMRLAFTTPMHCAQIELCCRTFIPAHVDAVSNDARPLGICVARLQLDGTDVPLEDTSFFERGWHELERQADGHRWRWSHGRMLLPAGTRIIVIELHGRGYHWSRPTVQKAESTGRPRHPSVVASA